MTQSVTTGIPTNVQRAIEATRVSVFECARHLSDLEPVERVGKSFDTWVAAGKALSGIVEALDALGKSYPIPIQRAFADEKGPV